MSRDIALIIDSYSTLISIPDEVIKDGEEFFSIMDKDMDQGWKVGPEYFENPDQATRIKIVADRLMAALESEKKELSDLLAGYIIVRDPGIKALRLDMNGEPLNTEIIRHKD